MIGAAERPLEVDEGILGIQLSDEFGLMSGHRLRKRRALPSPVELKDEIDPLKHLQYPLFRNPFGQGGTYLAVLPLRTPHLEKVLSHT